jgi:hypothetical protein
VLFGTFNFAPGISKIRKEGVGKQSISLHFPEMIFCCSFFLLKHSDIAKSVPSLSEGLEWTFYNSTALITVYRLSPCPGAP